MIAADKCSDADVFEAHTLRLMDETKNPDQRVSVFAVCDVANIPAADDQAAGVSRLRSTLLLNSTMVDAFPTMLVLQTNALLAMKHAAAGRSGSAPTLRMSYASFDPQRPALRQCRSLYLVSLGRSRAFS